LVEFGKKMARPRKREGDSLSEALKEAIRECGLSFNELARETGVRDPIISRFMNGSRSLSLKSAEKLFAYFGFSVVRKGR
jgi:plasmid maintenance system antidote protein VapI